MAAASSEAIIYYPSGVMRETYEMGKSALHMFINTQVSAMCRKLICGMALEMQLAI